MFRHTCDRATLTHLSLSLPPQKAIPGPDGVMLTCYATLAFAASSRIEKEEWNNAFDFLANKATEACGTKKDAEDFTFAARALSTFLQKCGKNARRRKEAGNDAVPEDQAEDKRIVIGRPGPLINVCKQAIYLFSDNTEATVAALGLLGDVADCFGRAALPWALMACDVLQRVLDDSTDNSPVRSVCYSVMAIAISKWGFGVGALLINADTLRVAWKLDWSNEKIDKSVLSASADVCLAVYSSGAAVMASSATRNEMDAFLYATSSRVCFDVRSASPSIRAKFLRILVLVVACPVEGKDASVSARAIVGLLERASSNRSDDCMLVQVASECLRSCSASMHGMGKSKIEAVKAVILNDPVADDVQDDDQMEEEDEPVKEVKAAVVVPPAKRVQLAVSAVAATTTTTSKPATTTTTGKPATTTISKPSAASKKQDDSDDDSDIPDIV